MPFKDKEEANAWSRKHYAENKEVRDRHSRHQKNWKEKNQEKDKAYRASWAKQDRLENPEFYRAREFEREMREYGTTVAWYRDRLIEQHGVCYLCGHLNYFRGKLQRLQVDHNHACCDKNAKSCGNCLRGLLCNECNITLSYIEKWIGEKMHFAIQYLDSYKGTAQ